MTKKKLSILGAGESGIGAAILAKLKDYEVFVSDVGKISSKYRQELIDHKISFEEGIHSIDIIGRSDLVIKSPGISDKIAVIQSLRADSIPVISEIEFAFRHSDAIIIAITGSNGKTTTTELTYHLLHHAGLDVAKAGNIGESFARRLAQQPAEVYVLEISSFQLDNIQQFKADIAVLLNITADHLDRYDHNFDAYAASKMKIAANQNTKDYFIVNLDDSEVRLRIKGGQWKQKIIGLHYPPDINRIDTMVSESGYDMSNVTLKGRHNMLNASVAIHIAELFDIPAEKLQEGLESFKIIPHRMERIARINGVRYINDSKATNVDAVFFALDSMQEPVILIAGGTDKGNDYTSLDEVARQRVKALICLGVENQKLKNHFETMIPEIRETQSVSEAVEMAEALAQEGWTVLLSPACASFDLFNNYIDRGDQFRSAVWQLIEK